MFEYIIVFGYVIWTLQSWQQVCHLTQRNHKKPLYLVINGPPCGVQTEACEKMRDFCKQPKPLFILNKVNLHLLGVAGD